MLKRILDDNYGFTYTLEAILGIFLIMGTVVYVTTNMPYTAQKTGEFSKVQLVNIGRDTLDLTLIAPISEACPSCLDVNANRQYLLCIGGSSPSDCTKEAFVKPNETINFTVYYTNGTPVDRPLNFRQVVLGNNQSWTNITYSMNYSYSTGNESYSFPLGSQNEYLIQAFDSDGWSNYVTVKVGYYNLISDTSGIFINGDLNVSGVVYDTNDSGAPNLTIRVLDSTYAIKNPSAAITNASGNFSFIWNKNYPTGLYYIQATDGTYGSNMHLIVFSDKQGQGAGNTLWVEDPLKPWIPPSDQDITIYETYPADLFETKKDGTLDSIANLNNFFINGVRWGIPQPCSPSPDTPYSLFYTDCSDTKAPIRFIANIAGDYYIYQQSCGNNNPSCVNNAQDIKTNGILIHVLPLLPRTDNVQDNCVNATELNTYMRRYMPAYVNYNLYLIGPTGSRFTRCPDFPTGQLINGYPTPEAMAVSKLAHIKYEPTNVDNIIEYRMVLWYK